jgi:aminoglycoside phosphotransferase
VAVNVVAEYLAAGRERLGLARFGVPRRPECVLLTPRFRRSRHIVVLVLGPGGREPVLVAKLPRLAGDGAAVAREARNLRAARAAPAGTAPELVAHRDEPGHPLLLQTALAGRPLGPAAVRHDRDGAVAAVTGWLERLAAATATFPPDNGWYERLVAAPLRTLAARGGRERDWARATLAAAEPLREAALPLVLAHGDLGHPNLLLTPHGRLGVLDWERAEPRGLPVGDLVFFLAYAAAAGRGDHRARVARLRAAFAGPRGWAWQAIERHADALGIERRLVAPLVAVSCARVALDGGPPAALDAAARHLELWEPALRAAPIRPTPVPA